ncbi:hypothetical protein HY29_17310 [Hyphomonas beringensis]|uniref:Enoyl reductase (ER) domain-containing protein n=1 Tax=Hyphomonas beringensis TaxID=1280946 RepID=A0A062U4N1_9PROT|nr:NADPH:quinone reductase [Hyphomonas beringensis]KCZ53237.1 hypothetical protein HY29_17310 [Hyphomonas beringensis]
MKAIWFDKFGTPSESLQYGELPKPAAGPGEVLVKVHTSSPNPSDVKKRSGATAPALLDGGYIIPHSDGAGVIEAVGDGVPASRIGERVWLYQAQYGRRFGTAAEYITIESRRAPRLPDEAGFDVGACLGIPVMTAHRCVFADGDVKDKLILVTGGAGRVGYYAIQWASQAGAKVIATASNPDDNTTCWDAGADIVINHRDVNWPETLLSATGGRKVDRVVDVEFGENLQNVLDVINVNGVIATYSSSRNPTPTLPFYRMMFMDITLRTVIVYAMPEDAKTHAISDIEKALTAGALKHRIAQTLPLESCAKAHEMIESGDTRGCLVLNMDTN